LTLLEVKWQAPVLLELTLQRTDHVGRAWGGVTLHTGSPLVHWAKSTNGAPLIVSEFSDAQGRAYIAVVNNSQTESDATELCIPCRIETTALIGEPGVNGRCECGGFDTA